MSDCCKAPVGADLKFFTGLVEALEHLEFRGADRILMDLSVPTKKAVYQKLLVQARRIAELAGSDDLK